MKAYSEKLCKNYSRGLVTVGIMSLLTLKLVHARVILIWNWNTNFSTDVPLKNGFKFPHYRYFLEVSS